MYNNYKYSAGKIDIGEGNNIDYKLIRNNEFSNIAFCALVDYYSDIAESDKKSICNGDFSCGIINCSIMNKDISISYNGKEISVVK